MSDQLNYGSMVEDSTPLRNDIFSNIRLVDVEVVVNNRERKRRFDHLGKRFPVSVKTSREKNGLLRDLIKTSVQL